VPPVTSTRIPSARASPTIPTLGAGRNRRPPGRLAPGVQIDLSGRTAVVTGSSQGIGLAIGAGLARAGASVVLNGRDPDKLAAAAKQVDGDVRAVAADVTTDEGTAQLLAAVPDADVLVNNLGIFGARPALEISDDEWRRYFEVNVLTAVRLTRAYLPACAGAAGAGCSTSPATPPSPSPRR
jgi:NAD(P)-dependent dehydrogenase (short-subunit alcohol dehydrogenase family)